MGSSSESQSEIYERTCIVLTLLSVLTCLFIILCVALRLRKDLASRFVLYLFIANFFLSLSSFIFCINNTIYSPTYISCEIQTTIVWYFIETSILWLAMIAIHNYQVVCRNYQVISQKQHIITNAICWTVPLITILPSLYSRESYTWKNEFWCSFTPVTEMINIWLYYLPCLIIIIFCYTKISLEINQLKAAVTPRSSSKWKMPVYLFSFVFFYVLIWTPFSINSLYQAITNQESDISVQTIVNFLIYIQGLIHCCLYGINKELVKNFRKIAFGFSYDLRSVARQNTVVDSPTTSPPTTVSSYFPSLYNGGANNHSGYGRSSSF